MVAQGYLEKKAHAATDAVTTDVLILGLPAFISLLLVLSAAVCINILAIVILIILKICFNKRTPKGNLELASWLAFKKYLVYGTALGVSAKMLSQLLISFDLPATGSGLVFAHANLTGFNSLGAFNTTFNSGFGAHGVGSSGGFSSGGGGGAG